MTSDGEGEIHPMDLARTACSMTKLFAHDLAALIGLPPVLEQFPLVKKMQDVQAEIDAVGDDAPYRNGQGECSTDPPFVDLTSYDRSNPAALLEAFSLLCRWLAEPGEKDQVQASLVALCTHRSRTIQSLYWMTGYLQHSLLNDLRTMKNDHLAATLLVIGAQQHGLGTEIQAVLKESGLDPWTIWRYLDTESVYALFGGFKQRIETRVFGGEYFGSSFDDLRADYVETMLYWVPVPHTVVPSRDPRPWQQFEFLRDYAFGGMISKSAGPEEFDVHSERLVIRARHYNALRDSPDALGGLDDIVVVGDDYQGSLLESIEQAAKGWICMVAWTPCGNTVVALLPSVCALNKFR